MGAGREHGVRPAAKAILVCEMKLAADFIQGDQAVVTVESSVFETFGHNRTGELLKFHREGCDGVPVSGIMPLGNAGQKDLAYEIEDAGISGRTSPFGRRDSAANVAHVFIRNFTGCNVSAVDRKAGDHFRQSIAQAVECKVASTALGQSDTGELVGKYIEFACQRNLHDQHSAGVGKVINVDLVIDKASISALHRQSGGGINKHAVG